ncbi:RhoGAP domain protein, partial [Opisthorchis viverrini]
MVMERLMRKFHTNPTPKKKYPLSSNSATCTVTFGQPLRDIVQRDKSDIPLVVQDIFDFLLTNHGLEAQGIFRVNGNSRTVEMLRNLMDEAGAHWRVSDLSMIAYESERSMDVFSVASLLKLYLRELPDSLVPAKMTPLFLEAYRNNRNDKSACFSQLEQLITQLPVPNYTLLQHLCHFLSKVWNCRAENKMSGESLGIVFGPSVFHIGQDSE